NPVLPGGMSKLRVLAQVVPAERTNAAGILSWYVDVLNARPAMATADYGTMLRSLSDNDPLLSSGGVNSRASRTGIHDTVLNRPGVGVTNPVELLAIRVQAANAAGVARFQITAGTGVPDLSSDFLVNPLDVTAPPLTGGEYTLGGASLIVCSETRL